jgi:hypothetical protein
LGVVVLATAFPDSASAQAGTELESVMAAFVHRFAQFVQWPDAALSGHNELRICVAAPGPFVGAMQRTVAGRDLLGRAFVIREVGERDDVLGCHVLFISSLADRPRPLIDAVKGQSVLTVGDAGDFLELGGIINLRVVDRRIRFAIDAAAADQAGLRLSSHLLSLAVELRGAGQ